MHVSKARGSRKLERVGTVSLNEWSILWRCLGVLLVCSLLWGCGMNDAYRSKSSASAVGTEAQVQSKNAVEKASGPGEIQDWDWAVRVVTEDELYGVSERDLDLTPKACREILARLNAKADYYISDDIRSQKALKAPNDFSAYKDWTPLPRYAPELSRVPKVILVAREFPFLGWYEKGKLLGDTQACIGKSGEETEVGVYKVEDKHADYYSRSYPNAFGQPAWMPWSMRIYGGVYIHAGDLTGAYCSHGCVTLPLKPAEELFRWADTGTMVIVVDSLKDLERVLRGGTKMVAQ